MLDSMLNELRQEAATMRRVLEGVPEEKLSWKPHAKSMSLGQLSFHVASLPGNIVQLARLDEFDASQASFDPPMPSSRDQILATFDDSVSAAENYISGMDEKTAAGNWRLTLGEKEVFAVPRIRLLRSPMLNHWYHHRGQLTVYLRLLDVPVPVVYGRSADENPFA